MFNNNASNSRNAPGPQNNPTNDESDESKGENLKCPLNCCQNIKFSEIWISVKLLYLMIFMLLFGFSKSLHTHYRDNLIYKQVCREHFQSDYMFCYNIGEVHNITRKDLELLEVIKSSSSHVFAMIGMKTLFEYVSACFLCSWSDSCGRKVPLLIALFGQNFDISSFFVKDISFVYFKGILYVLTALSGLFGGYISIFALSYCYLTDCSSVKNRAIAFTMIDFTYMIGIISGVVYFEKFIRNYVLLVNFLSILVIRIILIIWVWLLFGEREFDLNNENILKRIRILFSVSHMKKTYKAVSKWRLNCESQQLLLLVCSAVPVMVPYSLIEGVIYANEIHSRHFQSFSEYREITMYFAIYTCLAECIAIIVYNCLSKFKDSTLGIIGFLNLYLTSFICPYAKDNLTFLVGLGLASLKGFAVVGLRSSYSKICKENERGKLFFFYASSELLATFFGYFLYEKLRLLLKPKDDVLPHMVMSMALILPLCTFTFQVMSIHTDHLFKDCYRNLRIENLDNISSNRNRRIIEREE